MNRIVVGVDGSEGSRRALLWAAEEAALRNAKLDVIHTYEPTQNIGSVGSAAQAEKIIQAAHEDARELVDNMVLELHDVDVTGRAVKSFDPARTLVEESKGAAMLVVSSRGLGSVKSLLLGSVSQQVAHDAECPVVIIRAEPARQH